MPLNGVVAVPMGNWDLGISLWGPELSTEADFGVVAEMSSPSKLLQLSGLSPVCTVEGVI